jgi:homoserine/homoserine lactone efflux protein
VHIAAAAVGLSATITASAWWFSTLKWLGALYLGYVGALGIKLALAEAR